MNIFNLTKVKVQSINDVAIPARASNKLWGDAIMLGTVYFGDITHYEILETIFSREELYDDKLILEIKFESIDDKSECNEKNFPYDITLSILLITF